jgi:hypothetical protein
VTRQFEADYNTIPWRHKLERSLHIAMLCDRLVASSHLFTKRKRSASSDTHFSADTSQVFIPQGDINSKTTRHFKRQHTRSEVHSVWRLVYTDSTLRWAQRVAKICARVQCDVTPPDVGVVHSRTGSVACLRFIIRQYTSPTVTHMRSVASWIVATMRNSENAFQV